MLELQGVSRHFGAIVAVEDATVSIPPGVITAVVGENGAGKSTLMKMGAGMLTPTHGKVTCSGEPLVPATPTRALALGVGMVHQHFMLVGTFTALENMVLGHEPTRSGGQLDLAAARTKAQALMKETGLTLDLDALTDELTVGQRQRLEILRVLYRGARVLLLDEPTAVLSPLEAAELFTVLRRLADEGRAIAVVTHRLDEVVEHADRVVVMRRGRVVHEAERAAGGAAMDAEELTRAIMGREPPIVAEPPEVDEDAAAVLEVRGLTVSDPEGHRRLDGVDLSVRRGEVVGVAGVEGNGQRELARALAGLTRVSAGAVLVGGVDRTSEGVAERRAVLGVVHEDRHVDGLVLDASVHDNLVLGELDALEGPAAEARTVRSRIERFGIHPARPDLPASGLSGGNQQKIVTGRVFDRMHAATEGDKPAALVLSQPTRGVDVGAASVIHEAIARAAAEGLAILVISADLAELRRLSHRILVIHRGRIVAELPPTASDEEIGRAMLGLEAA